MNGIENDTVLSGTHKLRPQYIIKCEESIFIKPCCLFDQYFVQATKYQFVISNF